MYEETGRSPPSADVISKINQTKIIAEPGYDADEFLDFFGDLNIDPRHSFMPKKSGRGIFNNVACGFFNSACKGKKVVKTKFHKKITRTSFATTTLSKKTTVSREIFGTYYQGLRGTSAIFLPQGLPTPAIFVPDPDADFPSMTGIFFPPTKSYP